MVNMRDVIGRDYFGKIHAWSCPGCRVSCLAIHSELADENVSTGEGEYRRSGPVLLQTMLVQRTVLYCMTVALSSYHCCIGRMHDAAKRCPVEMMTWCTARILGPLI